MCIYNIVNAPIIGTSILGLAVRVAVYSTIYQYMDGWMNEWKLNSGVSFL